MTEPEAGREKGLLGEGQDLPCPKAGRSEQRPYAGTRGRDSNL